MAGDRSTGDAPLSGRPAAGRPLRPPGPETRRVLSRLQLVVTRRLRGLVQGEHLGLFPGPGAEPGESRVYVPGDDVRLIDWNVTARTGELHVRDPVADHEVELWLLADVSASQHFGTTIREKREVVVGLAAAFGLPTTRLANRVGAVIVGGGALVTVPPACGRARLLALLRRMLATPAWEGEGRTDLAGALGRLEKLARRRGVVVVISDFLCRPGWEAALGRLGARHDLVVAEVVDPRELELKFRSQTAVGEAIHASLDALATDPGAGASGVVVLSDGTSTTGRPDDAAAQRARIQGVPVSTIAFGTTSGTVVLGGETLSVPPDGPALRAIADATGGRFFEAASGAELADVYRTIGRSVTTAEELQDLTAWFVGAALLAMIAAAALALAWFGRLP